MNKIDKLYEGFKPLVKLCVHAGAQSERERIRGIVEKQLDLAKYTYDQSTIEILTELLKELK